MCDGSAKIRFIHSDPPNGMLEKQHNLSDTLLRFQTDKVALDESLTVQYKTQDVPKDPEEKIKYENSFLEGTFIEPDWEEKYERTRDRTFVPAINRQPNSTPLYYCYPLL